MRSDEIKKGIARAPHRSLLYATGVSKKNIYKPFIGIASSYTDMVPGHITMRDLERQIERGIHTGGGQSFVFGVPAVCDGIAMGHNGMRYSLPSRELIADCIETFANAHQLDGLVLLTNCDKITPELPRAPLRVAKDIVSAIFVADADTISSSAFDIAAAVMDIFVPVSPSGTGKTFKSFTCCLLLYKLFEPDIIISASNLPSINILMTISSFKKNGILYTHRFDTDIYRFYL